MTVARVDMEVTWNLGGPTDRLHLHSFDHTMLCVRDPTFQGTIDRQNTLTPNKAMVQKNTAGTAMRSEMHFRGSIVRDRSLMMLSSLAI